MPIEKHSAICHQKRARAEQQESLLSFTSAEEPKAYQKQEPSKTHPTSISKNLISNHQQFLAAKGQVMVTWHDQLPTGGFLVPGALTTVSYPAATDARARALPHRGDRSFPAAFQAGTGYAGHSSR